MMISTKDEILMNFLNCGICDLAMLNDIQYNLSDIVNDMKQSGNYDINTIFADVFYQGSSELLIYLMDNEDDIKEEIKAKIKEAKDIISEDYPGEDFESFDEYTELKEDLELIESGKLNPEEDMSFYTNYQDTSVSMKHLSFYRKYMPKYLEEVENNMGFEYLEDWDV